jgi:hypothetical protein
MLEYFPTNRTHTHNMSFPTANSSANATQNKAAACFRAATKLVPGENGALKVAMDHAGYVPLLEQAW